MRGQGLSTSLRINAGRFYFCFCFDRINRHIFIVFQLLYGISLYANGSQRASILKTVQCSEAATLLPVRRLSQSSVHLGALVFMNGIRRIKGWSRQPCDKQLGESAGCSWWSRACRRGCRRAGARPRQSVGSRCGPSCGTAA